MNYDELLKIYVTESDDLLAEMERGLVALETNADDKEIIHQVFRAAHTLKGNAGMTNIDSVVAFAHVMETVLDELRSARLRVNQDLISVLLASVDALKDMTNTIRNGDPVVLTPDHRQLIKKLEQYKSIRDPDKSAPEIMKKEESGSVRVFEILMKFRSDLFSTGQDPSFLIQEIGELGDLVAVEPITDTLPVLDRMKPDTCYLGWRVCVRTDKKRDKVEAIFIFVKDENQIVISDVTNAHHHGIDISIADKKIGEILVEEGNLKETDIREALGHQKRIGEILIESGKVKSEVIEKAVRKQESARKLINTSSIRVDTDKLDRLVNLVGELVICMAQVDQKTRDATVSADTRISAVEILMDNSRELQELVMSLRMVPIRDTFDRFRRMVRDLGNDTGKHIVLEMSGTETELDKNVIEQLVDPLKHIIRNCVSHGIEKPAERIAAGKSDTGRIYLDAAQREGHIIISVADDGKGIDPDAVLQKARQLSLISNDRTLSQKEIYDLLFRPGFSTAEELNEVSGRGVGLDVVRKNVEALRGTVEIESEIGKRTVFRVKLPLTLAIIDGMNVKVGDETVTIPLLSVVELIEPEKDVIGTVEGKGEYVEVRGELLPMIRLADLFNYRTSQTQDRQAKVVIVENEGRKFGILVDRVLGMEQAVIRSLDMSFEIFNKLESTFQRADGIAGATILGDGTVGLIADVNGLERKAFGVLH
jgi:two-component system, chemotaxis family, sensor kinase CheA